jgi:hypothetical protein
LNLFGGWRRYPHLVPASASRLRRSLCRRVHTDRGQHVLGHLRALGFKELRTCLSRGRESVSLGR